MDVFDVVLTDPLQVDSHVFQQWLCGHSIETVTAYQLKNESIEDKDRLRMKTLFLKDTVDQYRLYDSLEHYLRHPETFYTQNIFQVPLCTKDFMIQEYFTFDEIVVRHLLGRKLTTKYRKHLDDISEHTKVILRSCRRQFDNLRRIYSAMEDRNFRGNICQSLKHTFHLSDLLAWKYTCVLFLLHGRFEVHPSNKRTAFLTWNDLEFLASVIMQNWLQHEDTFDSIPIDKTIDISVSISSICINESSWDNELQKKMELAAMKSNMSGIALDIGMTSRLRDIKTFMMTDNHAMSTFIVLVLERIATTLLVESQEQLKTQIKAIAHGLFIIAERLSQPEELKGFFEDLLELVGQPLKVLSLSIENLDNLFNAFKNSFQAVPAWYLFRENQAKSYFIDWTRFLDVCRICLQRLYTHIE